MDLIGLVPSFGNILYTIAAFVVALSVIVAIHEYGHYIVGRWSGIHAEVFSLGFGPVLFKRTDQRGTQWQVAAIPLGGYVKFKGDANAASAPDASVVGGLTPDERRMTMQGAPLWARAATVAAGPLFNFALSILVFGAVVFATGVPKEPLTVDTIRPLPYAPIELRQGDELVAVEGATVPELDSFTDWVLSLPEEESLTYTVRREGRETDVRAPHPMPAVVVAVSPQSAAMDIDLKEGDVITAVDGQRITAFEQLRRIVGASDGRVLELDVWRDGEALKFALKPRRVDLPLEDGGFETRWLIGISGGVFFETERETPGVFEALGLGVERTASTIQSSLSALYHMAAGAISSCNLSGPVRIAETSGEIAQQGIWAFIGWIALLSTAVGLINLFPIPILDGGHLVFHAWEAVSGRPPGERAMRVLMAAGLTIVLAFMSLALANDLFLCP